MANANPMVRVVFCNLRTLLRDVELVQLFLAGADARLRENDARLAVVAPLLVRSRRLVGVEAGADEIVDEIEEMFLSVLEERLRIVQAFVLLAVVLALTNARRRARRRPGVLVAVAALAFAVTGRGVALGPLTIFVMVFSLLLLLLAMV